MVTKVLVFESDPAFAGELRSELDKLGCATTVVEDGNLGLQQAASDRPDLILLSIELPRMNGFSVCNKLKKDPNLKDVPLIIMSSESSDETFEQHKKLRTRAEDYVHKPIAFGELLQHVQAFVPIVPPALDSDGAIVIDDEIEIGSTDDLGDEPLIGSMPDIPPAASTVRHVEPVDADVNAFAESAFGRLTAPDAPFADLHPIRNGASPIETAAAGGGLVVSAPAPARPTSITPPPVLAGIDPAEHERVRDELARATARSEQLGQALDELHGELERLRADAAEADRRGREIEELRARLASSPKSGAVSSREFLDLREALNKKDKEILGLKELLSKKDKQIVEAQDRALASERTRADIEDRLLALERELDETKEKNESLAADRELAKKASDDFRSRLDKARADVDAKERLLAELRARHEEELAGAESRLAATRAEVDQVLANERAEHARALDQAEERRKNELDQARREHEAHFAAARGDWEQELAQARAEAERRGQEALEGLRAELLARADRELAGERERAAQLGAELAAAREEGASLRGEREQLESKAAAAEARAASLDAELGGARRDLAAAEQRLSTETARAEKASAKWQADRQSLERAKDALAVALAQIEEAEERAP